MKLALLLLFVAACGSFKTAPPVPTCTGGTRLVDNQCVCALGTSWNGNACQGTPMAGICQNGAAQFGAAGCFCPDGTSSQNGACVKLDCASEGAIVNGYQCYFPDGTVWNGGTSHCDQLSCTGGAFAQGHQCQCPDGTSWQDDQCEIACVSGATHTDANHCACPQGEIVANNECEACNGGAVVSDDGSQCVCPSGEQWEDTACAYPPGNSTQAEQFFHKFVAWTDGNGGSHFLQSGLGAANQGGYQPRFDLTLDANGHFSCDVHFFASDGSESNPDHIEGWWSVDSDHFVLNLPGLGIAYKTWQNHEPGIELHAAPTANPNIYAANTVVDAFMTR